MCSLPRPRFLATFFLLLFGTVSPPLAGPSRGAESAAARREPAFELDHVRVEEAVLFAFDDNSIPFTGNLVLSMEKAEKYSGNPVLPLGSRGEPDEWQDRYYGSVIRQGGKFKMWYIACSRENFSSEGVITETGARFAYAESPDGIHWTKPRLGLVEFRGSRDNNLVQMPDGFRGYHALVCHEPEERDPSRRFKMMARVIHFGKAAALQGIKGGAFVPLYSGDGLRWRVADELVSEDPKTLLSSFHLPTHFEGSGLYRWKSMYYLTGQSTDRLSLAANSPYGRHVQIYRSSDFVHWSETQAMGFARPWQHRRPSHATETGPDSRPWDFEQTHEGASVWNRGNVLIGITGFWHGATDWMKVTHDLGFLISNDGLHFREPEQDFLLAGVGTDGRDWDTSGLAQGQGFENVGEKTFIWYGQMSQREGIRTGKPWLREGGIGLLTLDRDRFGSLSVRDPDRDGTLVTSEIKADRPVRIWVNAEGLGPDSRLRIELLDESEHPLPAYAGTQAAVLEHSGLRVPLTWKEGVGIAAINAPFKIQARLEGPERNAIRLYALYLGE